MTSISVSEYRNHCSQLLRDAIRCPGMYFRSLEELQAILSGHAIAYEELGIIDRNQSFERCFVEWLRTTYEASCSAGWAVAVEALSGGQSANDTFARLTSEFLEKWEGIVQAG